MRSLLNVSVAMALTAFAPASALAARGESPAAFGRRCIPPGCVAPPSNIPDILGRRALPAGRIAGLGATPDFHHGLLRRRQLASTRDGAHTSKGAWWTPGSPKPSNRSIRRPPRSSAIILIRDSSGTFWACYPRRCPSARCCGSRLPIFGTFDAAG
jgi:hypothetical protein